MNEISVYIHIPFCKHRCDYCDFNTYAGMNYLIPDYVESLQREIEFLALDRRSELTIDTIYFGGGTPSLLSPGDIGRIVSALNHYFTFSSNPEISLEANPGTVNKHYLAGLRRYGVNRISLGMQSANITELKLLGRQHSYWDVQKAVEWSREVGFDNINLDLIFGVPYQTMENWVDNLGTAISLKPEHLSLYALTVEDGTPLQKKIEGAVLPIPDPDLAADMYESACEILSPEGYVQYEISNWAVVDRGLKGEPYYCRHNLQYWHNLPYIGLGAGAHGFIDHVRSENVKSPGEYIHLLGANDIRPEKNFPQTPATKKTISIDRDTEIGETMMMGLRLVDEGVSNQEFMCRFGEQLQTRFGKQIDRLINLELLEWSNYKMERLRLTKKGRLLGNQVFCEFI